MHLVKLLDDMNKIGRLDNLKARFVYLAIALFKGLVHILHRTIDIDFQIFDNPPEGRVKMNDVHASDAWLGISHTVIDTVVDGLFGK
jgi:hypothetical protein